jgi:hypothetical protein
MRHKILTINFRVYGFRVAYIYICTCIYGGKRSIKSKKNIFVETGRQRAK